MMLAAASPRSELLQALAKLGFPVTKVDDAADLVDSQPAHGWDLLIVDLADGSPVLIRRAKELLGLPVLAVADEASAVAEVEDLDDFIIAPIDEAELATRLQRLTRTDVSVEVIRFKDLELDIGTYQATLGGEAVDLTFMEYELLRFFASNPGRVWSRAQILSMVWGYDYFGGSRTVDVHVRRLRAKLGEERRSWIETVRSVGYRFGP